MVHDPQKKKTLRPSTLQSIWQIHKYLVAGNVRAVICHDSPSLAPSLSWPTKC